MRSTMQITMHRPAPPSPSPPTRRIAVLIGCAIFLIMHHRIRHRNYNNNATATATATATTTIAAPSLRSTASSTSTPEAPAQELLTIYELPPSFASEPKHLTPIDPATIVPTGSRLPIDAAHRNGLLHAGSVLYVADASGKLLFLRRSPTLVTCPSKWSILGEHSTAGEEVVETAVRGIEEELGFVASGLEERDDAPGTWTAELRPAGNRGKNAKEEEEEEGSNGSSSIRVTISNATEFPLYYVRHYGPRNDNRVDRQLTYTHLVKFPKKHTEIEWKLDEEVADHKWIGLEEVRAWYADDAARSDEDAFVGGEEEGAEDDDDGPDQGDFCHGTVRSLYDAGLEGIV